MQFKVVGSKDKSMAFYYKDICYNTFFLLFINDGVWGYRGLINE